MRAVLDTNVVISALIWGGTPREVLRRASAGDFEIWTSPFLLDELRNVLERAPMAERLVRQGSSSSGATSFFTTLAKCVTPVAVPRVVPSDTDDDHVIAAAVAAQADLVVSGDKHLLSLVRHGEVRIVTPAAALALIRLLPRSAPRTSGN